MTATTKYVEHLDEALLCLASAAYELRQAERHSWERGERLLLLELVRDVRQLTERARRLLPAQQQQSK